MQIVRMTNKDKNLYFYMWPFVGSRKVAKELGIPVWDDDNIWFIAFDNDKIVGFCSYVKYKTQNKAVLKSAYVLDEYRRKGIYDELFRARLEDLKKQGIKRVVATTTSKSWSTHERYGFKHTTNRGRYRVYEKEVNA